MRTKLSFFVAVVLLLGVMACTGVPEEETVSEVTETGLVVATETAVSTENTVPTQLPVLTETAVFTQTPTPQANIDTGSADGSIALPDSDATPTSTRTPSPTPKPIATSELISGWLVYESEGYGYSFSYPAETNIRRKGVDSYPSDELPAGVDSDTYLRRLKEQYPNDICVLATLPTAGLSIHAPEDEGGKYAPICPGLGIGAYDVVESELTVMVNGRSLTSSFGNQLFSRDEAGTFRSEFYLFELVDGTKVTLYAGPEIHPEFETNYTAAYDAYTIDKSLAVQMLATLQHEAEEAAAQARAYMVTDPPLFVGGEVRLLGWSPNGRYLSYFEYTQAQLDESPGIPGSAEGTFVIYDVESGARCTDYGLDARYPYEGPGRGAQRMWLPDGAGLLILVEGQLLQTAEPCGEAVDLTAVFPEPPQYFGGFLPDPSLLLVAGESRYYFYDWQNRSVTELPEVVPDQFNNLVWSPNGDYLAVTLAGDYTGNREDVSGTVVVEMATGQIVARYEWVPVNALDGTFGGPVWLNERDFVVTVAQDQGPFRMNVDGEVTSLLPLFDLEEQQNLLRMDVYVEPNGDYHMLLIDWGGQFTPIEPRVYHSDSDSLEMLPTGFGGWLLTPEGMLLAHNENNVEVTRAITAVNEPLTADLPTPNGNPCSWRWSHGELVFVSGVIYRLDGCEEITAVSLPEPTTFLQGIISPEDKILALIADDKALYLVDLDGIGD